MKFQVNTENNPPLKKRLFDIDAALNRLGGDHQLLDDFIRIFEEDSPGMMSRLENGLDCGDALLVERTAHSLKGMMSNFGAQRGVELLVELERAGRSGTVSSELLDELEQLRRFYGQLCGELEQYREKS